MAVLVILRVFSGRPDPEWTLTPSEEVELQRHLTASRVGVLTPSFTKEEALGYRGFDLLISKPDAETALHVYFGTIISEGVVRQDRGRSLERWLLGTGSRHIGPDLSSYVSSTISIRP